MNRPDQIEKGRIYGFNIFNVPIEDILEYAAGHNLRHIEINLTRTHSSIKAFPPARIQKIRQFTQTHGIGLSLHLPSTINVADIIPMFRRKNIRDLIQAINLAGVLGASHITVHIGTFFWFPVEKWMRKKALTRFISSISHVLEHCERNNVCLALENVVPIPQGSDYYFLGDNVEDFHFLFERLDSPYVRFCLDIGHANMAEGPETYIRNFNSKLITVHYHDNNGNNDDHMPVNEGNIDWNSVTRTLVETDYKGPMISECRRVKPHESAQLLDSHFQRYNASPVNS